MPNNKGSNRKGTNIIKVTLHNDENNVNLVTGHPKQLKHKKYTDPQHQKTKWATSTYSSKETKKITKSSKET
jgi:hypothetical protein